MEPSPVRLLIVEDNPGDARLLSHLLQKAGPDRFTIIHVDRLQRALDYLSAHPVDLVLLDLSLPDARGLETVRRITAAAPDTPIVVLTGLNDEGFALQAVREGAQDYLLKSQIDTLLLVRSIGYAIERQRLLRERKQAEKELKASQEFALNIIDSSLDIIIAVDHERHLIKFNRAAEQAFGYQREEVLGQSADLLYSHPEEGLEIHQNIRQFGRCVREVSNRRKNGEIFPALLSASALRNAHGEIVGVMGISRDITERKQAEIALRRVHEQLELRVQERTAELLKANAALQAEATERRHIEADLAKARDEALSSVRLKSQFLANMSHEIRTPLNGVVGMANLLLKTQMSGEQRDYAHTLHQSANALLTIINDILDFSKIEAGKLTFEVLDFDLRDAVEATLEMLAEPAQAKNIELIADFDPSVPTQLVGDPVRLRQILANLISNAVKFTESGEVIVQVRKESETDHDLELYMAVRDSGIGIPQSHQSSLFTAFSQADGSTTRKYGGTGLGLAICKQLVSLMQGEIGFESETGSGSTFWFKVRLRKQLNHIANAQFPPQFPSAPKILLIEPVHNAGQVLLQQFQFIGWEAHCTPEPACALDLLNTHLQKNAPFNVVFLSLTGHDTGQRELAQAIKSNPSFAAVRLVLMSFMRFRVQHSGVYLPLADAWLLKPLRLQRVMDCLHRFFSQAAPAPVDSPLPTPASSASSKPPVSDQPSPLSDARVLVAEDHLINQKVAVGFLHELGCCASVAHNGFEVLEALRAQSYDLIFMDCQMPQMDGYETTQRIRKGHGIPQNHSCYIIAMTAHAMQGDREKCLASGMNDYITKPLRQEDLAAALERWKSSRFKTVPSLLARPSTPQDTAAPIDPQREPVDLKRLLKVSGRDPVRARELAEFYLNEASQALGELQQAIASNANSEIERITHKCSGASSTCGMIAILPWLTQLESAGRNQQIAGAQELHQKAAAELDRMRQYLHQHLFQPSNGISLRSPS